MSVSGKQNRDTKLPDKQFQCAKLYKMFSHLTPFVFFKSRQKASECALTSILVFWFNNQKSMKSCRVFLFFISNTQIKQQNHKKTDDFGIQSALIRTCLRPLVSYVTCKHKLKEK